ncbi:C39 family peptidase [Microbacterium sp. ASV49]|uniref:C39 family peptidase n=1 Tax=Microbacterium candidum TaxID=3041922 RepID=UPI0025732451|nr:C39 family peptidase [Microbacterium sp. ASV49]
MSEPSSTAVSTRARMWRTRLVRADIGVGWDGRRWTSGVLAAGFPDGVLADQAVASWNLAPGVTARIELRARTIDGTWSSWQPLAAWGAPGDRRSASATPDAAGPYVDTDVLTADPGEGFDAVELRLTLDETTDADPLRLAAVSFSAPEPDSRPAAGDAVAAPAMAVAVEPLSQRAYPERDDLGGGGPAWCSPTSLTMVAAFWGARIPSAAPADVPVGADPRVPWVARAVYDSVYDGTGNWSFNVAVAAELGLDAVVSRLRSLEDARALTDAGIPLIASISFGAGELPGADYETAGHLLVLRGFDAAGDVLVADPANAGGQDGLRTYPSAAFDAAWARSRRTVYLVTSRGHALPPSGVSGAW